MVQKLLASRSSVSVLRSVRGNAGRRVVVALGRLGRRYPQSESFLTELPGVRNFRESVRNSGKAGQTIGILEQGFTGSTGSFLSRSPACSTIVSDALARATCLSGSYR